MEDENELELEPGDFLYQPDRELFLVVMEEQDDSFVLAAHGWRNIDKQRLKEYVDGHGSLHRQDDVDTIIDEQASDDTREKYNRLLDLFQSYAQEFDDDGPHTQFALDE